VSLYSIKATEVVSGMGISDPRLFVTRVVESVLTNDKFGVVRINYTNGDCQSFGIGDTLTGVWL
jgi:hypothetical protein